MDFEINRLWEKIKQAIDILDGTIKQVQVNQDMILKMQKDLKEHIKWSNKPERFGGVLNDRSNNILHAAKQMVSGYTIKKCDLKKLIINYWDNVRYKRNCEYLDKEFKKDSDPDAYLIDFAIRAKF